MAVPEVTAPLIYLMREASGLGMMDCKKAAEEAVAHFGGDFVLTLRMRHYHALAVNIRSLDPAIDSRRARRRWNAANALGDRDDMATRDDAWRRLDEVSTRWNGRIEDL